MQDRADEAGSHDAVGPGEILRVDLPDNDDAIYEVTWASKALVLYCVYCVCGMLTSLRHGAWHADN